MSNDYGDWISDDITFCGSPCDTTECFRHPSNIRKRNIPHSFSMFKGTDFARNSNLPCANKENTND